jgi:hypothetical protein
VHVLVAAQCHVQRRAALGVVHALAGEQALDRLRQAALARERHQQRERLAGDALLGEVERDAAAIVRERRAARCILAPEVGDAPAREAVPVRDERLPGGRGGK